MTNLFQQTIGGSKLVRENHDNLFNYPLILIF